MAIMHNDPGVACPLEVARFEKTKGRPGLIERGDEFRVRLPGPWNGPVRVIEVAPCSFRLATLEGHMEAGEIEFRAQASCPTAGSTSRSSPGLGARAGRSPSSMTALV